ncbi:hypothetical protein GCM10025777_39950 [Membranihabitans marinus]
MAQGAGAEQRVYIPGNPYRVRVYKLAGFEALGECFGAGVRGRKPKYWRVSISKSGITQVTRDAYTFEQARRIARLWSGGFAPISPGDRLSDVDSRAPVGETSG